MEESIVRILLLSGGLDSAVLLYRQRSRGDMPDLCLSVDYGQPHLREVGCAQEIASGIGVPHEVVRVSFDTSPDNGILGGAIETTIILGCNLDDRRAYRDCRPEWATALGIALGVSVELPFAEMTKREIVALAREHSVPFDRTVSCYQGDLCCKPRCAACVARSVAISYPFASPLGEGA